MERPITADFFFVVFAEFNGQLRLWCVRMFKCNYIFELLLPE